MAFSESDLLPLEAAIKSGTLTVTVDGKSVTYRTMAELIGARNLIKAEVEAAAGTRTDQFSYATFDASRGGA